MAEPNVTIAVIPREQFSKAKASLDSIFAATVMPFAMVYVDGNSPEPLRRHLEHEAAARHFTLVRRDHYLPSNVARNLAMQHVRTRYVVFIDNDVLVAPRWLERLVACAAETGAWVVGPLYCVGDLQQETIHTAGADMAIVERAGRRRLHEQHHFCGRTVSAVRDQLKRGPIDLVEFHCLLMRSSVLERIGAFDEALLSFFDHNDFCLMVKGAGGSIWVEPSSIVGYLPPPPFALPDVRFFLLRWSDRWLRASLEHFVRKHNLDPDDPAFDRHVEYQQAQRARLLRHPRGAIRRALGDRGLRWFERAIDAVLELTIASGAGRHREATGLGLPK